MKATYSLFIAALMTDKSLDNAREILQQAERARHERIQDNIDLDFDEACAIRHALEMPEESITSRLAESHLKELGDIEAQKDADRKRNEQAALDALAAAYKAQEERYAIEFKKTTERKEKGCT